MQYLLFHADGERYLLASDRITEVVPQVPLRSLPGAPAFVAGLMNYRGEALPVIDVCRLLAGYACAAHLSTRVLVVRVDLPGQGARDIGLLVERATEMLRLDPDTFTDPGIDVPQAPWLGQVYMDRRGMMQCLCADSLLSASEAARLFETQEA